MFSRRQLLKLTTLAGGQGLAPLLLPALARAQEEAAGKAPPQRFVFVIKSSGLTPAELVPQEMAGRRVVQGEATAPGPNYKQALALAPASELISRPLAGLTMHDSLAPLAPLVSHTSIVQGLSGKMCRGGHSSWFGAMGCYKAGGEHDPGKIQGPTFDGIMARHLPAIFPHLGLATRGRLMGGTSIEEGVVYPGLSAIAKNRQIPYQATPMSAYRELFSLASSRADDVMQNRLQGTLLDFMVDDIGRLKKRLGGAEREKLDLYLSGFEALRERRRRLAGVEATVRKAAPPVVDKFTSTVETDRIEAHFDIATAALVAGLTHVVSLRLDGLGTLYTGLGADKGVHGLGHGEGADPIGFRRKIRTFHVEQIARMAQRLQQIPEGDGTMLDNTLIVYFSDAGEKHHASSSQWPFVLVGGLGGRLKQGRYLQYPSYGEAGHHTIANLYNTLASAVGHPQQTLGQLDSKLSVESQTGPLAALLT